MCSVRRSKSMIFCKKTRFFFRFFYLRFIVDFRISPFQNVQSLDRFFLCKKPPVSFFFEKSSINFRFSDFSVSKCLDRCFFCKKPPVSFFFFENIWFIFDFGFLRFKMSIDRFFVKNLEFFFFEKYSIYCRFRFFPFQNGWIDDCFEVKINWTICWKKYFLTSSLWLAGVLIKVEVGCWQHSRCSRSSSAAARHWS